MIDALLGNANLFTKCLFTILVPFTPPLPISKVMDVLLNSYEKTPQTELRTLSQDCEQTLPKLRTIRITNKPLTSGHSDLCPFMLLTDSSSGGQLI